MTNILKKSISSILSAVMLFSTVIVGIPLATVTAKAAEIGEEQSSDIASSPVGAGDTGISFTLSIKDYLPYVQGSAMNTELFIRYETSNNIAGYAFCSEPSKNHPLVTKYNNQGADEDTTFNNTNSNISQIKDEVVKNILYYGFGGPGLNTYDTVFRSGNSGFESTSKGAMLYYKKRYSIQVPSGLRLTNATDAYLYMFTHIAVSYALHGEKAAFIGYNNDYKSAVKSYVDNIIKTKIVINAKPYANKASHVTAYSIATDSAYQKMIVPIFKKSLEFKKMSSQTFSNNNSAYSLEGAQFVLFTDLSKAQNAAQQPHNTEARSEGAIKGKNGKNSYIMTDKNGIGHFYNFDGVTNGSTSATLIDAGDLYIVEFRVPTFSASGQRGGYQLNSTVKKFTDSYKADKNGTPIYTVDGQYKAFIDHPKMGLTLMKRSSIPDITDNNECYSLAGAEYGIYSDKDCINLIGTITTDETGNGTYLGGKEITAQQLWAKEITPSPGFLLDTEIHQFVYSGKRESASGYDYPIYSFESVEQPDTDPLTVLLQKYDATTGEGTNTEKLADAQFQVDFYPKKYTTVDEIGSTEPLRSWVFKTDKDGYIEFSSAYKVSGHDFWYQNINGEQMPTIPYGTITVKEIVAPPGYQLNPEVYIANIDGSTEKKISWRTTNVNEDKSVLKFPESQDNGGLEIRKTSTDNKVEHLWFRVTAEGYSKDFETDKNGLIINDELSALDISKTYTITELGYKEGDNQYHYPRRYGTPPAPQTVTLQSGKTTSVMFKNSITPTELNIHKESGDNKVANFWFKVTSDDGSINQNISTDNSGLATLKNLPAYDDNDNVITYTVSELGQPNGDGTFSIPTRYMVPNEQAFDFTENDGESDSVTVKELTFVNQLRRADLAIGKTTSPNTYNSQGIWFNLSSSEGFNENRMVESDRAQSEISFPSLDVYNSKGELIEYTITELGYKNANGKFYYPSHFYRTSPVTITLEKGDISAGHNSNYIVKENSFINRVKNVKLQINKTAFYNDVSSVWFRLSSTNGYSKDVATGAAGTVTVDSLPIYDTEGELITYTLEELGYLKDGSYVFPERYVKPENQVFDFLDYDDTEVHLYSEFLQINPRGNIVIQKDVENTPKVGNLKIVKTSDDDVKEGFYFNVKDGTRDFGNYATNADGTVLFTGLPIYDANDQLITYTVTELGFKQQDNSFKIPDLYVTPSPKTVTLTADGTEQITTVNYHNTVKPSKITVRKVADDGVVEHIFFKITNLSTNQVVGIYETDSNGKFFTEDLPCYDNKTALQYKIEELGEKQEDGSYNVPNKYNPPAPVTITLTPGETTPITFTNTSQVGYVAAYKSQSLSNTSFPNPKYNANYPLSTDYPLVEGAKLGLYKDNSCTNKIAEAISGSDGYAVFGPIPYGKYYIKELEAPEGYFLNTQSMGDVDPSDFAESETQAKQKCKMKGLISNIPVTFWVYKFDIDKYNQQTDSYLQQGLPESAITVYDSHNEIVDNWITDGTPHKVTGEKYNKLLHVGETYRIEETHPTDGYSLADPVYYTIEQEKFDSVTQSSYNDAIVLNKKTETYITKTDMSGEVELEGAHLMITDTDGTVIDEWVSAKSAHLIRGLVAGKQYFLKELEAPDGYVVADEISFNVNKDGSPTHVTMRDYPTQVEVDKTDPKGNRLANVNLQIISQENNEIIDDWITDGTSSHKIIGELIVGKTYILREKSSPNNYSLAEDIIFTVKNVSSLQTITMKNKYTETYISKTDITGTEELEGAHFVLFMSTDGENLKIDEWTSESKPHLITGLIKGKTYVLTETVAPNGYTKSESSKIFTVNQDGSPTYVQMKDAPTKIKLEKVDETGKRVADVRLQIIDENNNVIDEWKSNDTSDHEVIGRLAVGKTYRMHEVSAPDQYVLGEDVAFTVQDTPDVQLVRMVNKKTETYISKTEITGTSEISGAHLQLSIKGGDVVEEWISTSSPHLVKGLKPGVTYALTETLAPNGYTTASTVEFNINSDGTPTYVVMRDDVTKVKITKVDESGNRVADVTLRLVDSNNNTVDEWVTDGQTDKMFSQRLTVGKTYTLKEISAPPQWVLADDITFTVKDITSVQTIKMTNKLTETSITKTDITDSSELPGAYLIVTDSNGSIIDGWTSGTEPHIIKGLHSGQIYTLTEQSAPTGYTISESINFLVRHDGQITQVVMQDAPIKMRFIKRDENGNPLAGVVLQVRDKDNTVVEQWTTNDSGTHEIDGTLKVNTTYYLHEVSAPNQYELANDVEFTVQNKTEVQTVVMDNKLKTGSLQIIKTSDDNKVEGFYFNVKNANGIDYGNRATDSNGKVLFTELPVYSSGNTKITYIVTEMGFKADNETFYLPGEYKTPVAQTVTLSYDSDSPSVTVAHVHNESKPGRIKIIKTASDNVIQNVYFRITNLTTETVLGEFSTNSSGIILTQELPSYVNGTQYQYKVEELGFRKTDGTGYEYPSRYGNIPAPITVTVTANQTIPVHFNNTSEKGYASVTKRDADNHSIYLAGAKFGLYSEGNLIATCVTGSNGKGSFGLVPLGTYIVKEIEAPPGYVLNTSWSSTITVTANNNVESRAVSTTCLNTKTSVSITKLGENEENMSGCVLKVMDSNNNLIERWTYDGNVKVIRGLVIGDTYTLIEESAIAGYTIAEPVTFTVQDENTNVHINDVTMQNTKTETYFSKYQSTGNSEIAGAHLSLSVKSGDIIEEWVSTNEPHIVRGLKPGITYVLTETLPPNGFTTAESVEFTINPDGTPTHITMRDDYTKVRIIKVDENGNGLAGVTLQLLDENGEEISRWKTTATARRSISRLVVGKKYTLRELSAPPSYVIAPDVVFVVQDTSEIQEITMRNEPTKTYISKTDITGDNEIAGAHLTLSEKDGEVISEWVSAAEPKLIEGLEVGKTYVLTETQSPDGYTVAETIEFHINADGTPTHIEMADDTTKVEFVKIDTNNTLVKGVVLQVLDSNNNVIDEWTTDGKTNHRIDGRLIVGKSYKLHEVSAPNNYTLAGDRNFTVKNITTVQSVRMVNHFKLGQVTLVKKDENGNLAYGSTWQLFDVNDNPVSTAITGSNGTYTFLSSSAQPSTLSIGSNGKLTVDRLPLGTYYFKEVTPLSKDYFPFEGKAYFTISADDENSLNPVVTVKNNPKIEFVTGGIGDSLFYILAGVLALISSVFIYITIFKKRRNDS